MDDGESPVALVLMTMKFKFPDKKQRGQIIIMMMFAAIPLFLMMAYVANGGYLVAEKTRLQNSADTAALVEATWTARSLNIISMNNTAAVQSHAIASAGMALERPLLDAGLTAGLISGFYLGRIISIGNLCPPWCYILSVPIFGGLLAVFSSDVMAELVTLQRQVEYANHDGRNLFLGEDIKSREAGFARAAASFAKMNRILVEEFPKQIDQYSKSISAANYNEGGLETHRYTAWSPEPETVEDVVLPLLEQSLKETFNDLKGAATGGGNDDDEGYKADSKVSEGVDLAVKTAARLKDLRDFYNAGKNGTATNPYASISMDYFGNFKKHGYTPGNSPFDRLDKQIHDTYLPIFEKLEGYRTGNIKVKDIKVKWWQELMLKALMKLIAAFIGTPYLEQGIGIGNEKTNPKNFQDRFEQVFGWNTHYGEANYSDSVAALYGDYKLPIVNKSIGWPKRAIRGLPMGMFHGLQLSTYKDSLGNQLEDLKDELEELKDGDSKAKKDYVEACLKRDDIKKLRTNNRTAELWRARGDKEEIYKEEQAKKIETERDKPPRTNFPLNGQETQAVYDLVEDALIKKCEAEFEKEKEEETPDDVPAPSGNDDDVTDADLPEGTQSDDNYDPGKDDKGGDNPVETDKEKKEREEKKKKAKGGGLNPETGQDILEFFNWLFEPHYQAMKLKFPLDSASYLAHQFLGDKTCPEFPGFICVFETPMYAVYGQRIVPEWVLDGASAGVDALGLPDDMIPSSVTDELKKLGRTFAATRQDWSLLIAQEAPMRLLFAPTAFGTVPETITVFAQSEVYNAEWFDMFTQSWKAKLVPVTLPASEFHRPKIDKAWKDKVEYISVFDTFKNDEQRIMNH